MTPTRTDAPAGRRPPDRRPNPRPAADRMDPRIRERRTAVVREAGRRRRRILLVALAVLAVVVGGWIFLHTRVLSARSITVVGSAHTPDAQIVAAAGLAGHPPLIDVSTGAAAAGVEALPWVATATVSRHWPDGVRIVVTERTPVAVVSTTPSTATAGSSSSSTAAPAGTTDTTTTAPPTAAAGAPPGSWALVDRTGRVLADVASPPAGLVHLVGPAAAGSPGSVLASAAPGLTVAASLPKAFAGQVTEVDVSPAGQITLKLTSPVTVNLGTTSQLAEKYEDVAALLAGATLADGDVIDVSVPESPTVTAA